MKINVRTQLDKERLAKQQESDAQNYLDAVAQSDEEKAASAVIEAQDAVEKAALEDKIKKIEGLELSRRFRKRDYIAKLAFYGNQMAQHIDWPQGYVYRINHNDEKLNIIIKSPTGKLYGRGIKPCGYSEYDFHALGVLLTQCENTVDSLESRGAYNKAGIIIPQ